MTENDTSDLPTTRIESDNDTGVSGKTTIENCLESVDGISNEASSDPDDELTNMFIGDLDSDCKEEDLRKLFSEYGEVAEVLIKRSSLTHKHPQGDNWRIFHKKIISL